MRSDDPDVELRAAVHSLKKNSLKTAKKSVGDRAERAAENHLVRNGYEILERNLRVGRDEIDLLVRREDLVAIVEVRARGAGAFEAPLTSVDAKKRAKLIRAAERLWRERYAKDPNAPRLRFDVIGVRIDDVAGDDQIEHIPGAFTA